MTWQCAGMGVSPFSRARFLRVILAAIPASALTVAVPLVNRIEPRIFGAPFLLGWIALWVLLTPGFLWAIGRLERRW